MKPEEKLAEWSSGWVTDGLVTAAQRDALLARHPVPAGGSHRFLAILAMLGGTMLVVGVSLIIKSNWDQIGDWAKILGLVALLSGAYSLGYRLKMSPGNYPRTGDACFMAGAVLFLLGIALVSQIFHLDSRPANGVLLWWAGIVVLPWLTRAKGMQLVSVIAGLTWLGLELASRDSLISLAPASGPYFHDGYLFAAAGVLVGWAVAFFGLGLRLGRHDDFAGLHENAGLLIVCFALYALSFSWSKDWWSAHAMASAGGGATAALVVLAAAGAGWAWLKNYPGMKRFAWAIVPTLVPVAAHLAGLDLLDSGWLWGACASVALFLLNLAMIRAGLAEERESWINLGMAFLALNIVTRYFLLFGSMLEGGVFFIVTGLVILGLGWYLERKRRSLVDRVRGEVSL
jgi:uncharacterized membrane protein